MFVPMLIGIAGGTGSGKSTFADGLKHLFPNEITIISYDNYYKPQDHLSMDERVTPFFTKKVQNRLLRRKL